MIGFVAGFPASFTIIRFDSQRHSGLSGSGVDATSWRTTRSLDRLEAARLWHSTRKKVSAGVGSRRREPHGRLKIRSITLSSGTTRSTVILLLLHQSFAGIAAAARTSKKTETIGYRLQVAGHKRRTHNRVAQVFRVIRCHIIQRSRHGQLTPTLTH